MSAPMFGTLRVLPARRSSLYLALAVSFAMASGCSDQGAFVADEEPLVPEVEVEALIEVLGVLEQVFGSEAWLSLREAGEGLRGVVPPRAPSPVVPRSEPPRVGGSVAPGWAGVPSVAGRLLGRTMVFSASAGLYVVDPNRRGAPGDGVRLVLYQPQRKGVSEMGWLDIRDQAPTLPNAWQVSVLGVERGRTFADYTTRVSGPAAPGLLRPTHIELDGLAVAANELLKFDIDSWTPDPLNPTLDIDWLFGLASRGFSIQATVAGVPITGQGVENLDFTILFRGFRWRIRYNDRGGSIDALIRVNGLDLATTTGVISQPTIVGPPGRRLSARTRFLILRILLTVSGVFETHNDLFTPPGAVIFQGL